MELCYTKLPMKRGVDVGYGSEEPATGLGLKILLGRLGA